jgi:GAF domain-containing protein
MAETTLDVTGMPKPQGGRSSRSRVAALLEGLDDIAGDGDDQRRGAPRVRRISGRVLPDGGAGLLRVGPYQGTLGCGEIPFGKGVCGTAAPSVGRVIVPDVSGSRTTSPATRAPGARIVVPVYDAADRVLGVFDVDSAELEHVRLARRRCHRSASSLVPADEALRVLAIDGVVARADRACVQGRSVRRAPGVLTGGEQYDKAYGALNPMAQVPLLVMEDGARSRSRWRSSSTSRETVPEPALLLAIRGLRARIASARRDREQRRFFQPLQNLTPLARLRSLRSDDDDAWARHFNDAVETRSPSSRRQRAENFLVGDAVTFADVVSSCRSCRIKRRWRHGVPIRRRWPLLAAQWNDACNELPAFPVPDAAPRRQP